MSPQEVQTYLGAGAKTAIVSTFAGDGRAHVTPVWYVMEDELLAFRSFTKSQRIVNLRRDPRLTVLVEDGVEYAELRGVMIQGTARLVDDPEYCLHLYVRLAERYPMFPGGAGALDEHAVRTALTQYAAKNTAVVVQPENVISWDHPKLQGGY